METWLSASPTAMCGANQNSVIENSSRCIYIYICKYIYIYRERDTYIILIYIYRDLLVKTYPSKNFLTHLGEAVGIIWFWTPVHELALQFPEPPQRALSIIIQMVRNKRAQVQHHRKVKAFRSLQSFYQNPVQHLVPMSIVGPSHSTNHKTMTMELFGRFGCVC